MVEPPRQDFGRRLSHAEPLVQVLVIQPADYVLHVRLELSEVHDHAVARSSGDELLGFQRELNDPSVTVQVRALSVVRFELVCSVELEALNQPEHGS